MKAMQDKEFDKVFTDALADMDVEPSDKVWRVVSQNVQKPKRNYRWLALAASLLITASVGLWFLTDKKEMPEEEVAAKKTTAKTTLKKAIVADKPVHPLTPKKEVLANVKPEKKERYAHFTPKKRLKTSKTEPAISEEKEFKNTFNLPRDEQVLTAWNDKEVANLAAISTDDLSLSGFAPEKLTLKQATLPQEKRVLKKPSVKSLGDLVNLVVAKVDKREDKIIRFSDNDGESNITGVNLGFINIQKEK